MIEILLESLKQFPSDRSIFYTSSGEKSIASILDTAIRFRENQFSEVRGKRVSLLCADVLTYIECLISLDGWASDIVLLDASIAPELLQSFEEKADVEQRIVAADVIPELASLGRSDGSVSNSEQTSWIIPTSGTTGTPKLISHTLSSLTKSVKGPSPKSSDFRWGLLYDPTRFAGLQVMLQSVLGGSSLILPDDWRDLEAAVRVFEQQGCNALSATPSLWRKLAISGRLQELNFKLITLGGEAPDQKILDLLRQAYPDALLRHIYASTEAGVGFSVADGKIGFPASFLETPPQGISLRVKEDGMLMLKPSNLEQIILSKNASLQDEEGWIESGDLVEKTGDRYEFLGRLNGAINVGGQKVHPTSIENVITDVEGVAAVRAYGQPSSILGNLVAVEIELASGYDQAVLKNAVKEICLTRLSRFQRPAVVEIVDQITLTNTGKIKR